MTRSLHVAYVDPGDPGLATLEECVERWWSTRATMAAVARHGLRVSVILRTRHAPGLLHRDGVEFHAVADDRLGRGVALAVRRLRPHVIHGNGFVYPARSLVLHLLNRRVPLLVQHHGEPPAPAGSRAARLQAIVGRRIDAALFTGGRWGAADPWLTRSILHPSKVHDVVETVVPGTIRDRDEARRRTGIDGDPAVLWVGRLEPGKDPLTMVRAAELAADRLPGLTVWMIGPGGSLDTVVRSVAASVSAGNVRLVDAVDHAEMAWWYAAADIVASTSHAEGSGFAVLEALAAGVGRVVTTDLPSHRTILGTLGPCGPRPGDAESFADALVEAWSRPPRLRTAPDPATALVELYRSLADRHR